MKTNPTAKPWKMGDALKSGKAKYLTVEQGGCLKRVAFALVKTKAKRRTLGEVAQDAFLSDAADDKRGLTLFRIIAAAVAREVRKRDKLREKGYHAGYSAGYADGFHNVKGQP